MDQPLLQPANNLNPLVFLDVSIGDVLAGRLVIELRKDVVPKTAENFRALCTGERGIGQLGKPLHYKGIRFHKVTRIFVAQSGDVVNNDGTSGESIYGPVFEDENFALDHEEGVISMANYGKPGTNNSQFVITSVACSNLNGTNVVVGKVLRGLGLLAEMEECTTDNGVPTKDILISDCGELQPETDWGFADNDVTADKLPPYPQDWEGKFNQLTSDQMVAILTSIRLAGNDFFSRARYPEALRKYRKANRYYLLLRRRCNWQSSVNYTYSVEDLQKLDNFFALNNLNIAAVELKLQNYENARYACTEAININSRYSKAHYRRGVAQLGLHNYEEAISDLKRANELAPENQQIKNEFKRAKKLLSDYNRQQMNILRNLFN